MQQCVHTKVCCATRVVTRVKHSFHQGRKKIAISRARCFLVIMIIFQASLVHAGQEKKMQHLDKQQLLDNPQWIPGLVKRQNITVDQIPDPHWRINGCLACHQKRPDKKGLHLRNRNVDKTCNTCHSIVSSHEYIHPSGVKPDTAMQKRMTKSFRKTLKKSKGKVVCTTCHDLPMQCKSGRFKERGLNPLFFRAGPYAVRSGICYQCHNVSAYQRLNPHDQITDKGTLRQDRCSLCHADLNKLKQAESIQDVDFNVNGDLSAMCTGCHPWRPHPGGSMLFARKKKTGLNHLVIPPKDILRQIEKTSREQKIILPLDPNTGRVFCGTCHNPHEKGVIKTATAARGADSKNRLRMKGICEGCHDK